MRPDSITLGQTRVKVILRYELSLTHEHIGEDNVQLNLFAKVPNTGYAIARIASYDDKNATVLCDIGPHNGVPGWQITIPWADVLEEIQL